MDVRDPPLHAHSSPQHRRNTKKINKKTWGKKWEKWRSVLFFVSSLVLQIRFNSWCGFVAFSCGYFWMIHLWVYDFRNLGLWKKHHETPTQRLYTVGCCQRQHVRSFPFWYLSNCLRGWLQIVGTWESYMSRFPMQKAYVATWLDLSNMVSIWQSLKLVPSFS